MSSRIDLTGQQFCRLLVVAFSGISREGKTLWRCQCACGAEIVVIGKNLRTGNTRSCGCWQREGAATRKRTHGMSKVRGLRHSTPTYRSWLCMIQRCTNPKRKDWPLYGRRGICVCRQWKDFRVFLSDMGERPAGRTIDRINPDGHYEPKNCRWATTREQRVNQRKLAIHGSP